MKQVVIETRKRDGHGKSAAKRARNSGFIPAVVYANNFDALNVEIAEKDFTKGLSTHGVNTLFNIKIGADSHTAMVREVQRAPLTKKIFHVDFHKISLDTKITTTVPVKLEGESKGVKMGGILEHMMWDLEIEVLPLEIPENIIVDIKPLGLDEELRVRDLKVSDNIKILSDPDEVVVAVHTPKGEEDASADILASDTAAEPEVIKKGKEEE